MSNYNLWIKNNLNVLLMGRHGVGKTSIVEQVWGQAGIKYLYYSTPTMDPWVDFVGIPKERKTTIDGQEVAYLDFVQKLEVARGDVEAFFFDEFNRAPAKVRNAVMELLQKKSINGRPFPNLRMVWAAINPDGDELGYDVMKLDPAQSDRFHIHYAIPYEPNKEYFTNKYGDQVAGGSIGWWKNLPVEVQVKVSPRRLDYALELYERGVTLADVLPAESNPSTLLSVLDAGPVDKVLVRLLSDRVRAREWIRIENNYASAIETILKDKKLTEFFAPLLPSEKMATILAQHIDDEKLMKQIVKLCEDDDKLCDTIAQIYLECENNDFQNKMIEYTPHSPLLQSKIDFSAQIYWEIRQHQWVSPDTCKAAEYVYSPSSKTVEEVCAMPTNTTPQREAVIKEICGGFNFVDLDNAQRDALLTQMDNVLRHIHSRKLVELDEKYNIVGWINHIVTMNGTRSEAEPIAGVKSDYVGEVLGTEVSQKFPYSFIDLAHRFPRVMDRIKYDKKLMDKVYVIDNFAEEPA